MNFLNFDIKRAIVFLLLLSLPLVSINTQQNPLSSGWYDRPFSYVGSLFQSALFGFSDGVRSSTVLYLDLINIKRENSNLKVQNAEIIARLQEMAELQEENKRLSLLLDFKQKSKMTLVAAKVMSRDIIPDHNTFQINKGTLHGLKSGQAVITVDGAIGHVFRPQETTAHVLLLTDRYSVLDGIVSRSRARGSVEGRNSTNLILRHVEKSEDVKVGDTIVTSGLDNIFPKGFPIARVTHVEDKAYSVSLKVDLEPIVEPRKVEEVFIVINAAEEDLTEQMSMRN